MNMKKLFCGLLAIALVATAAFAQEETLEDQIAQEVQKAMDAYKAQEAQKSEPSIKFSGEVKTGLLWTETQTQGYPYETKVKLGSKDDAGSDQGRYRLNIDYDNGKGFGMRARIQQENLMEGAPTWPYAFGYGNFFEDNMTVAIGRLGGSPWGTGGPEKWKELENAGGGGMRIEWKPSWVPASVGRFNVGVAMNYFDDPAEASGDEPVTIADLLMESVLGFSWTHDLFMVRFAYRLDSEADRKNRGTEHYGAEGGKLVYRVEEHMLKNLLPGMEIWALGVLEGVGAGHPALMDFQNWMFVQYAPDLFTAQIRLGLDYNGFDGVDEGRTILHVKPTFYLNFFNKLLSAGASFWYGNDYGAKVRDNSPFLFMEVEPKIQLNFSNSYIAFAYNWRQEYVQYEDIMENAEPIKQTQWMNLRFCIYF